MHLNQTETTLSKNLVRTLYHASVTFGTDWLEGDTFSTTAALTIDHVHVVTIFPLTSCSGWEAQIKR